jgi:hypothetical protein
MPGHQPPPAATTAFQPMRPSAILGTAFRLYRRHWRTLLPIIALAAPVAVSFPSTKVLRGPGSAYQVIVHHRVVATGGSWADTVIVALVVVVALVVFAVVAGAVTRAAVAAVSGEELGVRRGYGFGIGRLWPLLQVLLASWLLTMLGVVLLVVPGVIVGVLLVVSIPALVVEGGGARHALIRSLGLVGGQWWHTFGTVLLTWLLLGLAVNLVDTAVGGLGHGWLAETVAQALSITLVTPFAALVGVLLYRDLRARREPLDADLLRPGTRPSEA